MKKRLHRIRIDKFRDQHQTQTYYYRQHILDTTFLLEIVEMKEQLNNKWLLTLENEEKVVLTDKDFIFYIKKERDK
jgi:hypothetical protein